MSDLPIDRLDSVEPFSYNGCDVFGTFYVKQGRKTDVKRWAVIFTDLASTAIHIETINSLDTDSFLNAYRRFVRRRGPARLLRCDQGSNFIGGRNEMAAALKEMNADIIREELLKDGCDFINFDFNVPKASHMAGVWERMILSSRRAHDGLLMNIESQLDDELFRTLMTEVENIVNSRPLTYDDAHSPDDHLPISPQQILTLKSNLTLPPPGAFVKEDLYCHRR
ncbi:uncharacterized protein LOC135486775 [Lineus longissimus]|uniref:uncharacterized protein LOC135486775 n=1 Tax=Lineus longissimus TaxID=88925 RepID=UPI00315C623F